MNTLNDFNFKNKKVLVRIDLNSDYVNKKIILNQRYKASSITIKELKKKKAKIILLAHQGRPKQRDFTSLEQHCKLLNKFVKVKFIDDIIGEKAIEAINNLKNGDVILLDNIRKLKDEFKGNFSNKFVRTLSKITDIYVNDAFSVSHRKQASVVGFPKVMKHCIGRTMEKELRYLSKLRLRNALFILGGAKPEDNIELLNNRRRILSCGLFGQLCRISTGVNFGAQNKFLKKKIGIVKKNKLKNVEMPMDFAVRVNGKRKELLLSDFPSKYEIFDIGEITIKRYKEEIKKAEVVFMKGPAGECAMKPFCKGTREILKAISRGKCFSIIGGGHLSDAAAKLGIRKIDHISLSGGALLEFVAGKKLPGVEALK
ncbi:MAG: phosphoglycerate kinase [Nanoarchaeota archaeon]|nr:phosphoglycerate kinase [Nanoarchaeota archaeon]